jgi:dihydroxyacetone kinase
MKLDDRLKRLLAAECETPALAVRGPFEPVRYRNGAVEESGKKPPSFGMTTGEEHAVIRDGKLSLDNLIYVVDKMSAIIIENEVPFCELDSHAGDGDFGMSVAKGFRQLKAEWDEVTAQAKDIGSFLDACSLVIMEHCGGASGPIWGSAFRAAGKYAGERKELSVPEIAEMMAAVVKGVQDTGERSFGRGAVVGDKTLVDALAPYADAWAAAAEDGADLIAAGIQAAEAAVEGAKKTEAISARMRRAGTVGDRSIGYPDAGAYALGVIFIGIARSLRS